ADALAAAARATLDLVEVAPNADPPVCRIMDYGKYKYQAAQRAKESRRKSSNVVLKEMKYRPKIGQSDFETKTKKVERFLAEGHKVKVTIMFRGREVYHPELGKKILDSVAEAVAGVGKVEIYPRLDGRNMTMVLAPDKRRRSNGQEPNRPGRADARDSSPTAANEPQVVAPDTTPVETGADTD
ncbi:MAG: translation initiation factor IF-3, partial [Acidimicrobiales bacterium]|nr:translation initiation factor IF-3 [Acidimicrobiales bacterium]